MLQRPWDLVFLAGFAVYVGIRHVWTGRTRGQQKTVRAAGAAELALLALVMIGSLLLPVLYLASPWLAFADYRLPVAVHWAGVPVLGFALWLFWRSHADLGLNWSVTLELRADHALVTHGVYRRIRHPMYAAIFAFGLAQGLLLDNWLAGWSALVTFLPLYLVRVPREERMMQAAFGPAWQDYVARTGRLLPRAGAGGAG